MILGSYPWEIKPLKCSTVSQGLEDGRVVTVTKQSDGRFRIREECDRYFCGYLTRDQFLLWLSELRGLADVPSVEWIERLSE